MTGTRYTLEVQPRIPIRLRRLQELADDLLYSWDRQVRSLFFRLDQSLWDTCGHNPKLFLRRVSQGRLEEMAEDRIYMEEYNRALSVYDTYHTETLKPDIEQHLDPQQDLIAYFCAEFGFHESLPIYSGGLGILAGDHCKAASDLGIPFVAVGMLYRQGYFNQTIDSLGHQVAHYTPTDFDDLPVDPALDADGNEVRVQVELPGRRVLLRVWRAKAGHIDLYLLDSDLPENDKPDRSISYQLYGGDRSTRIQQEIVLGIGGVRALRALGLTPTVWHINEGHAAFMILERARERVADGLDFDSALELTASGTVFTTHTPVPAGHDVFEQPLIDTYFAAYAQQLGIDLGRFHALGANPSNHDSFNMTSLALRGSRFHNGVSAIHGGVAAHMERYIWPQIPARDNPMGHVTNGIHVPTFLAREWMNLFDMRFGGEWRSELSNPDYWDRIDDIPNHSYWSIRQSLKSLLLEEVYRKINLQQRRNGTGQAQIERLCRLLRPQDSDVLVLGFARRFATYKRATLLFSDPERLARLLNDPARPVLLLFAGKAHPSDEPGQQLIRVVHEFSRRPEFEGRILLLEGYDLALARKLVTGVDVWLNTPEYPLEASGTSGQKAGINGVINLSVLDGWWGEGYDGRNGWAITPHGPEFDAAFRNKEEAQEMLDIIEKQVIPLYYARNGHGFPEEWVAKSKCSMKTILPRFSSHRMVHDYVREYYRPGIRQHRLLSADGAAPARELAGWKQKIQRHWSSVTLRRADEARQQLSAGERLPIRVEVQLGELSPGDVVVECLIGTESEAGEFRIDASHRLSPGERQPDGSTPYVLDLDPPLPGLQYYKLRAYPHHALQSHPFETGFMQWL